MSKAVTGRAHAGASELSIVSAIEAGGAEDATVRAADGANDAEGVEDEVVRAAEVAEELIVIG
eukprot:5501111-Heterocapsa_arctica.AAC.1